MRELASPHWSLLLLLLLFSRAVLAEDLILSSPPRETPAAGVQLYSPLANYLSLVLGKKVRYQYPQNWLRYQRSIKNNEYDIVFDGPHFASWRIKHFHHTPVAKLPGSLQFFFVTKADNKSIIAPSDLAAKKVCSIPPPNLNSLMLLARLDGPAREPILKGVRGGMKKVYQALINDECVAAVLRTSYFRKKLSQEQQAGLRIIYTSEQVPNQVITVSDRVSQPDIDKIRQALFSDQGIKVTEKIVKRFAGKKTRIFVAVKVGEYDGYSSLLEGVILGWRRNDFLNNIE